MRPACAYAGISYTNFRKWMIRGEKQPRGVFRDFRDSVHKAQTAAEVRVVAQWQTAMPSDWKACRDFLARRFPERWAPKTDIQVTGKDGAAVAITIVEVERTVPRDAAERNGDVQRAPVE
jgi:hypothetical protein